MNDDRLQALNETLHQCRKSSFYKDRLPDGELKALEDIKSLPFTTKEDLRQNSPFGFVCVPVSQLYQYHETSGTTGTPASTWLSKEDMLEHSLRISDSGIKYTEEDIVLVRFPYAISTVAHFTHEAAQLKNACVIPASSRSTISPFPRIVHLMKKLGVTVLACLPMQAVLLAETAELLGFRPDKDFPKLRAVNTAGEILTPRKRKLIESIWGVPVYDNYGTTELGPAVVDCEYGIPHGIEDSFVFELLDNDMKNEVDPGQIGNLVVTTLTRKASPLIRYITGDRARRVEKQCPCGRDILFEIHGRKEDVIQVGDRTLDMWDLEEILGYLPTVRLWVAGPWNNGIKFVLEKGSEECTISQDIINMLESKYNLKLKIDVVPKGTLFDRNELLQVSEAGKPKYIYSPQEIKHKEYSKLTKY